MITTLRITNLAIIDELEVELGPGLNVLTGETGAGKSIIVGALGLVLGARASTEALREGADEGRVEAVFDLGARPDVAARLEQYDLPAAEERELLVRRVITRAGRNRIYVNGSLTTLQTLAELAGPLVDVSGQHEQFSLLNPANHLLMLDEFGDLLGTRGVVGRKFGELSALRAELDELTQRDADRAAREDFLRFQVDEIDTAELHLGEDAELDEERNRLRNAEALRADSAAAAELLYEGRGAVTEQLDRARALLGRLAEMDPTTTGLAGRLDSARIELEDVAFELRRYHEGIEADPGRLDAVETRLDQLSRLGRKYGGDVAAILERRDELAAELDGIEHASERRTKLTEQIAEQEKALVALAEKLSEKRRAVAAQLEKEVTEGLDALAMERAQLRVRFHDVPPGAAGLSATGIDRVELMFSPNVGEGTKPLSRVASGGELSRILLALKRALRRVRPVATYVFDEVDTGIGGAVAESVGRLIAETASHHQVLAITHLPQVACYADHPFRVVKEESAGRTVTRVRPLDEHARKEEVARMLAGMNVTDKSRAHAEEMIRQAAEFRGRSEAGLPGDA